MLHLKRFFLFLLLFCTSFSSQAVVEYTPPVVPIDTIVLPKTEIPLLNSDVIGPKRYSFKVGDGGLIGLFIATLLLAFLFLYLQVGDGVDEVFLSYLLPSVILLIGRIFIRLFIENKKQSFYQKEKAARLSFRPLIVAVITFFMLAFFTVGEVDTLLKGFALAVSLTSIPLLAAWLGTLLQSSKHFTTTEHRGKYGFKNRTGRVVIPIKYDAVCPFKKGLAAAQYKGKWGIINVAGETEIPFEYEAIQEFSHGLVAAKKDGKWGFLDEDGTEVSYFEYDDVKRYNGYKVQVLKDGVWQEMLHVK